MSTCLVECLATEESLSYHSVPRINNFLTPLFSSPLAVGKPDFQCFLGPTKTTFAKYPLSSMVWEPHSRENSMVI